MICKFMEGIKVPIKCKIYMECILGYVIRSHIFQNFTNLETVFWKVVMYVMKLFRALFGNLIFHSWNPKMITPCRWLPPAGQLNVSGPSWPTVSVSLYCSLLTTPLDQRKTKENSNFKSRKVNEEVNDKKLDLAKIHSYP